MSQIVNKIGAFLLSAALLLGLSACSPADPHTDNSDCLGKAKAELYSGLFAKGLTLENNLTVKTIHAPEDPEWAGYLSIDGLNDSAVQDKINARLKAVYEEMRNGDYIPPYRGIVQKLRQAEGGSSERTVVMNEEFNANGLLSVISCCMTQYLDPAGENVFDCSYDRTLTFDLATGEELSLADLFSEGTDFIELLNDKMDAYLLKKGFDNAAEDASEEFIYGSDLKLVAPFTSIKPGQKFYISGDGQLVLILDYETPEFMLDYRGRQVFPDIDEAFLPASVGRGLFRDATETYRLPVRSIDPLLTTSEHKTITRPDGFEISADYALNSGLPEAVTNRIAEICTDGFFPTDLNEFKSRAGEAAGGREVNIGVERSCYFNTVADYIGLTVSDQAYSWMPEELDERLWYGNDRYFCFKGSDPEPMKYTDVFKQPEKARELTEKAMADQLSDAAGFDRKDAEALAALLFPHMSGFYVDTDGLCLSYDLGVTELEELFCEALHTDSDRYSGLYCSSISYRALGCENLTLFD